MLEEVYKSNFEKNYVLEVDDKIFKELKITINSTVSKDKVELFNYAARLKMKLYILIELPNLLTWKIPMSLPKMTVKATKPDSLLLNKRVSILLLK